MVPWWAPWVRAGRRRAATPSAVAVLPVAPRLLTPAAVARGRGRGPARVSSPRGLYLVAGMALEPPEPDAHGLGDVVTTSQDHVLETVRLISSRLGLTTESGL
jgi:hypothetical protein